MKKLVSVACHSDHISVEPSKCGDSLAVLKGGSRYLWPLVALFGLILLGCGDQVGREMSTTPEISSPPASDGPEVARAWANITDQIKTYQVLQSLSGSERIQAANKLVFGYDNLKKDVDYFLAHTAPNDPRRSAVSELQAIMNKSKSTP